jgi:hypothetical protein
MQHTENIKIVIYTIHEQCILDQLQHYDIDGVTMSCGDLIIPSFVHVPTAIQKTRMVQVSSYIPQTEEIIQSGKTKEKL